MKLVHRFPDGRVLYEVKAGEKRGDALATWSSATLATVITGSARYVKQKETITSMGRIVQASSGYMLMWRELEPEKNEYGEVAP